MRTRYVFTGLSVVVLIACAIVVLHYSSRSTTAQSDGLKAQMQQEIIQALREIIPLREEALGVVKAKHQMGRIPLLEMEKAQLKLSEARIRLAAAEQKTDVAMVEFGKIKAMQEEQLQRIKSKAAQGYASSSDIVELKLQLLEERIRFASVIRDTIPN